MPLRGIEEMIRDAGRSLAARPGRGDERWPRRCGTAAPKISPMPRWGMARSAWQPGAAPAGAGLPPANLLWRPSGTSSRRRRQFSDALMVAGTTQKSSCRTRVWERGRSPPPSAHAWRKSAEDSNAPFPLHALRPGTGRAPLGLRLRRPVSSAPLRSGGSVANARLHGWGVLSVPVSAGQWFQAVRHSAAEGSSLIVSRRSRACGGRRGGRPFAGG